MAKIFGKRALCIEHSLTKMELEQWGMRFEISLVGTAPMRIRKLSGVWGGMGPIDILYHDRERFRIAWQDEENGVITPNPEGFAKGFKFWRRDEK